MTGSFCPLDCVSINYFYDSIQTYYMIGWIIGWLLGFLFWYFYRDLFSKQK